MHSFLRLGTRTVLAANHFITLPVPDTVVAIVNVWAHTNKHHVLPDPIFTQPNEVLQEEDDPLLANPLRYKSPMRNPTCHHYPGELWGDTIVEDHLPTPFSFSATRRRWSAV